jgi:hypothetical protein
MEAARKKVYEIEQSMQNILVPPSGQGQATLNMSHQEVSMSVNTGSNSSPDESMPAEQHNLHARHSDSVTMNIFNSKIYQKLPHPFSQRLKELPIVDGSDVNLLCDFLLGVIRMYQEGQLMTSTIHEILYPYCRGEVLELLVQAISARESFEQFHERLLTEFIPACQLSQLHVERYERVQAHSESLANYIQSIRDVALILCITETKAPVVQRIQRARFVFQGPPNNFKDLEPLIVAERNVTFADQTRRPIALTSRAEIVQPTSRPSLLTPRPIRGLPKVNCLFVIIVPR